MDYIFIENLRCPVLIGVYPREQHISQTVEVSLKIGLAAQNAGKSDRISDTLNYATVVERVRHDLATLHFSLLERLAEHIAELVLNEFGAAWVRVSLAKIGVIAKVQRVGVLIERGTRG